MSLSENGNRLDFDPLWYKDAVIYEVHVRAFHDSDGDGVGDFRGLTEKLDYLQSLGVTAIWLLPFYPSPLKDDGYDIADYLDVHPSYGTLRDFQDFLHEAHRRGLRVITELVLNHTSDQHPWFQRARLARPGSRRRDFYVWSDTPDRYRDARVIFKDFEKSNWTWDEVAGAYYWHRFYSHQPDLNFDNPDVQQALLRVVDFWLRMGVDGLRLDAVPYLYEQEGTNCENLPRTHEFLRKLRKYVDERFEGRMLLAEANQWPDDAIAYFGNGDEAHVAFHFPVMPRLFMGTRMEDRFPIVDILQQTPSIPETCQWALFLRNHDELTLEMVTDEERDYMYRVFAGERNMRINLGIRRRLAPLLGNNRPLIELMNGLLFSLPGTPVVYYGDEIGMGDNVYLGDRNGVRTPMQWSPDRNAGFSHANPQRLYLPVIIDPEYHHEAINVERQQNNTDSLLWWTRRLISVRKRHRAFGRGTLQFLNPENRKVIAYLRQLGDERILVVANLSRFVQTAQVDLSPFRGAAPVELFGRTQFPPVDDAPYLFTLAPYGFYWFSLEPKRVEAVPAATGAASAPAFTATGEWDDLLNPEAREVLSSMLLSYHRAREWYGGKNRQVQSANVGEVVPFPYEEESTYFVLLHVEYTDGEPETYLTPLALATGERLRRVSAESPAFIVARLRVRVGAADEQDAVLYDALADPEFCTALLRAIARGRHSRGGNGVLQGEPTPLYRELRGPREVFLEPSLIHAEQRNTSVRYADRLLLKVVRRLWPGTNPELEITRFLSERTDFRNIPPLAGALEYHRKNEEPVTVGILRGYVQSEGDARQYALDAVSHYVEHALARSGESPQRRRAPLMQLAGEETPAQARELIGPYLETVRLLGQRTAEMHLALASDADDPMFAPEPFSDHYRQGLTHSMANLAERQFLLLRRRLPDLPGHVQVDARRVLDLEPAVMQRFRLLRDRRMGAVRIRCHGDYHLGQVLYTGKDFIIIDFEGEPERPLSERRIKRNPLRDVAGMLRSFHYVSSVRAVGQLPGEVVRPEDVAALEPWSRFWYDWVSATFLRAYLETARDSVVLPPNREDWQPLLDAYLLEKACYEVGFDLSNRPAWVGIPLQGILQLLDGGEG